MRQMENWFDVAQSLLHTPLSETGKQAKLPGAAVSFSPLQTAGLFELYIWLLAVSDVSDTSAHA